MINIKGHIVDVVRREIFDGELVIKGEKIVEVRRCELPASETPWSYIMPGFVDAHVHIDYNLSQSNNFS